MTPADDDWTYGYVRISGILELCERGFIFFDGRGCLVGSE